MYRNRFYLVTVPFSTVLNDRKLYCFVKNNIASYYREIVGIDRYKSRLSAEQEILDIDNLSKKSKVYTKSVIAYSSRYYNSSDICGILIYSIIRKDDYYVNWILVKKKYRKLGLAKQLWRRMISNINRKCKKYTVVCTARLYNLKSMRFIVNYIGMKVYHISNDGIAYAKFDYGV